MGSRRRIKLSVMTVWTSFWFPEVPVQTFLNGVIDVALSLEGILDPCLPCSALHGSHYIVSVMNLQGWQNSL